MEPTTIMDNSLMTATKAFGEIARIVRWRPGLVAIHEAEEGSFRMGLHLKGKDFKSVDELNRYVADLTGGGSPVPWTPPETPAEKAMDLVYQTIGAPKKKSIEMCRQALATYAGCADAWVILSEFEKDPGARRDMLERAVKAGETRLRDEHIELRRDKHIEPRRGEGSLWPGPGRGYLRARLALAQDVYASGEKDGAIADFRDLMKLDPLDCQGVRYLLVSALLEIGSDSAVAEAEAILSNIRDDSPMWDWAKAFIACSKDGVQSAAAPIAVIRAYHANPYVLEILSGELSIPKKLPETWEYGSEEEAVIYCSLAARYWEAFHSALPRLEDAVASVTAGLPNPFLAEAPSMKDKFAGLWRARGTRSKPPGKDRYYVKALQDHPQFGRVWFTGGPLGDSFEVGGESPREHVGRQAAVEAVLGGDGAVSEAMNAALNSLLRAGLRRHEAVHLLSFVYGFDWIVAEEDVSPVDVDDLIAHLRYVTRLGSGDMSPDTVLTVPARNDQCPCGSGRKFKKCCGRHDGWPVEQLRSVALSVKAGRGKVSHRDLEWVSPVLGSETYATIEELAELPPEHPIVILDNTSAVIEALWEHGLHYHALFAMGDSIELARTMEDSELLKTALYEAVSTLSQEDGFDTYVSRYACELARMVEVGDEASLLWTLATDAFLEQGKMEQAEGAANRAVSTGGSRPGAHAARARYLEAAGKRSEALEEYREVIKLCARSKGTGAEGMADRARREIRRLENALAKERRDS